MLEIWLKIAEGFCGRLGIPGRDKNVVLREENIEVTQQVS